jgi:hypothetical protein
MQCEPLRTHHFGRQVKSYYRFNDYDGNPLESGYPIANELTFTEKLAVKDLQETPIFSMGYYMVSCKTNPEKVW